MFQQKILHPALTKFNGNSFNATAKIQVHSGQQSTTVNYAQTSVIDMLKIPLSIWFEIGALLISIACYKNIKDKPLRWFIPFLLLMTLVELTGMYIWKAGHANTWLYHFSVPVEYIFYTYLFYCYFQQRSFKLLAKVLLVLIPVIAILNTVFLQGFLIPNTNVLKTGAASMVLLSCLYFVDIFKREDQIVLAREPMFWIATGVLFFNAGDLAFNIFFDYILAHRTHPGAHLFISINGKLVYVLYTFISIALLCTSKPFRKTSQISSGA